MGMSDSFGLAFYKAQEATGAALPLEGDVLLTVADRDKPKLLPIAQRLERLGLTIHATEGTCRFLEENGVACTAMKKLYEGRPNIVDAIKSDQLRMIINTPAGRDSMYDDSYIRMAAIQHKLPYVTTLAGAEASAEGIEASLAQRIPPRALQEYYT